MPALAVDSGSELSEHTQRKCLRIEHLSQRFHAGSSPLTLDPEDKGDVLVQRITQAGGISVTEFGNYRREVNGAPDARDLVAPYAT
eukprot:2331872-Rhodomonas_salina.9